MTLVFFPTGLLALALQGARAAHAVIGPVAGRIAAPLRNRLAVQRLADLDDRALKDIGLVRSDVAGALAAPFHVDPSAILSDRRLERGLGPRAPGVRTRPAARPAHLPRPTA